MRSIARRTAVELKLLLVMPVAVWLWLALATWKRWLLKAAFGLLKLSPSSGRHYTFDLFGWFLWCLRFRIKAAHYVICHSGGGNLRTRR